MKRAFFIPVLALLVVGLHGLAHGWISGRWSGSAELQSATDRLQNVPLVIGDWQGEAGQLDPRHQAIGEIRGYALRRYVHRRRGETISVLLVCGKAGPIAVHTPDVCYRGAGYDPQPPQRLTVEYASSASPAEVVIADFRPRDHGPAPLTIVWTWNDGRGWRAPDTPRWTFGGRPFLYKLYVVREARAEANDDFLRELLATLDATLFPTPPPGDTAQ